MAEDKRWDKLYLCRDPTCRITTPFANLQALDNHSSCHWSNHIKCKICHSTFRFKDHYLAHTHVPVVPVEQRMLELNDPISNSTVQVDLLGARVLSWKNENGKDILKTQAETDTRGAYLCFPEFSDSTILHKIWELEPSLVGDESSSATLILESTDADLLIWPFKFSIRLTISVNDSKLGFTVCVRNTDTRPFDFTIALRNYLSVDLGVKVENLSGVHYLDNLLGGDRFMEYSRSLNFEGEIDRVYLSSPEKIFIFDHGNKSKYELAKDNFNDAVLCNPNELIRIDSASAEHLVNLGPNEEWVGRQWIHFGALV